MQVTFSFLQHGTPRAMGIAVGRDASRQMQSPSHGRALGSWRARGAAALSSPGAPTWGLSCPGICAGRSERCPSILQPSSRAPSQRWGPNKGRRLFGLQNLVQSVWEDLHSALLRRAKFEFWNPLSSAALAANMTPLKLPSDGRGNSFKWSSPPPLPSAQQDQIWT